MGYLRTFRYGKTVDHLFFFTSLLFLTDKRRDASTMSYWSLTGSVVKDSDLAFSSNNGSCLKGDYHSNASRHNLSLNEAWQSPLSATLLENESFRPRSHPNSIWNQIQHFYLSVPCKYILLTINSFILLIMITLIVVDIVDLSTCQSCSLNPKIVVIVDWVVTVVLIFEIGLRFAASRSPSACSAIKSLSWDLLVLLASIASMVVAYKLELNKVVRK